VTRDEKVLWPPARRPLIHSYSDAEVLGPVDLTCYALEEILAEKVRAVAGQRRFAISRDLYDIYRLVQAGVSVTSVAPLLTAKFAARGVEIATLNVDHLLASRALFEQDWQRRLGYLAPDADAAAFAAAWQATVETVGLLQTWLKGSSRD
jgi:predicted nucleotidyltransferase component of viral defense system